MPKQRVETYKNGKLIEVREVEVPQEFVNAAEVEQREGDAAGQLRAYVDTALPTPPQTVAVVKLLCRIALNRRRVRRGDLDAVD